MRRLAALGAALLSVACGHAAAAPPTTRPLRPAAPATLGTFGAGTLPPLAGVQDPLIARLDSILFNTDSCLLVADGRTGVVRYSHDADVARPAASAQKLLVAAAALDRLGPNYRFTTTVVAARRPVKGAVDDLWLVGGGDPLLASPGYAAFVQSDPITAGYPTTSAALLADRLAAAGVRRVLHSIHGDDGRFEATRFLASWPPGLNQGEFDIGPLGALELDQGLGHWHPDLPTADPTGHAAGVLGALLTGRGVVVATGTSGPAPPGAVVLASVTSAPLAQIVAAMLRASDNQIAELLVREIDRQSGGRGSTASGVADVAAAAAKLGLPVSGLALTDGSGLSRTNRITCRTLLGALDLGDQTRFSALASGLPVAGVSGTLTYLFRGTPLSGRLAAKGGYINGVQALVGRLDVGRPLRFAFVLNGSFPYDTGLAYLIRIVEALAAP